MVSVDISKSIKFCHKDEPCIVYTWHPENDTVTWEYGEGHKPGSTVYPTKEVAQFFASKTWLPV